MVKLTLAVAAQALLGVELGDDYDTVCRGQLATLEFFRQRCASRIRPPLWFPTRENLRYRRATAELQRIIERIIRERSAASDRDDVLSKLLHARSHESHPGMTDRQLRDETMTMLMAGHETTANSLTFTLGLLAEHPEVERRLLAELDEQVGDRPATVEDLPRLTYLEQVIKESMRLFPPAFAIGRRAIADCEIGGYRIPAKTNVLVSQWVTHRDALVRAGRGTSIRTAGRRSSFSNCPSSHTFRSAAGRGGASGGAGAARNEPGPGGHLADRRAGTDRRPTAAAVADGYAPPGGRGPRSHRTAEPAIVH